MSTSPLLSIIIVSFQTKEVLEACLHSVREQVDLPYEVIVIDNASSDGSPEMVGSAFPQYQLVRSGGNIGFSPANNMGMNVASGKYVLLLNPDTVVLKGSVDKWLALHEHNKAGISGPALIDPDGDDQVSAWKVPTAMDALFEALFLHRLFRRRDYARSFFKTDNEVGFVSGAAMLFERTYFDRIGGLDPELFWMEDADFCVRVSEVGGTCVRFHEPRIIHIGGQSSANNQQRMISNQLVSRIKFVRKHNGLLSLIIVTKAVYFHVLTRIIGFGILGLFRHDPRGAAYRYTFGMLNRYIFRNDRST